jgi:hypothetical protein
MATAITARCKERGNGPNRAWAIKCLNWQACWGEKERGEGGARRDPCGCGGGPARQGEEERKGEMERLTSGARVSATAKEKKKREGEAGRCGVTSWAGRPGWAERGAGHGFLFLKKLLFQTTFLLKFKSKLFQTFSQKFINFLETTQATKNHASQLMMHNHLLSLSLLNYV